MINRYHYLEQIAQNFDVHSVVALLGPRQCGKTTLAREFANSYKGDVHFFDLENPQDRILMDSPQLLLSDLSGLIIIDEIQWSPNLFQFLRYQVDQQG